METRKLELKDICGYLPYELKGIWVNPRLSGDRNYIGHIVHIGLFSVDYYIKNNADIKPVLRPISDLYKTITHNGKEIVPIVELAKICKPRLKWLHNDVTAKNELYEFGYDYGFGFFCYYGSLKCHIENQHKLFDYLHELKIDYRGLIDAGLAVDVNTLNENPYK